MKSRVLRTIAVLVMTIAMSGMVYVENLWATSGTAAGPGAGGDGGSGAGAGSGSSGGGDGGSGNSGGGDSTTSGGGSAPSAGAAGVPGDARLAVDVESAIFESAIFFASTSPVSFPRPLSSGGLTRDQERTWDVFGHCATRGSMIDQLRVDGSFTFQSNTQSDARTTRHCMMRMGYRFDH